MAKPEARYDDLIYAIERQNHSVHERFSEMRIRAGLRTEPRFLAAHGRLGPVASYELGRRHAQFIVTMIAFVVGFVACAIVVGPSVYKFVAAHWDAILLCVGTACVGAGVALVLGRIGSSPLQKLSPPDASSDEPLKELERLAERTAQRLRTAYRVQVSLLCAVFAGFVALVGWTIALVSQQRMAYASAFGTGSVAMLILSRWKWQPFDRMAQARRLADQADVLATALGLRMRTIQEIEDPVARAKAQWAAVRDYLKLS